MVLTKIFFFILIIICIIFYVLYVWDFSLVLLVVIASIPVIMFICMLIAKRSIRIEFALNSKSAAKNESFDVQLCITNSSFMPIGKAEAFIEYYNVFNSQINSIELHFPIQPNNSQRVTFQLSSKFCGTVKIRTAYVNIYDPLRIFKFRIGKNSSESIAILPEGHDISGFVSQSSRMNEESSVYSEHRPGDDPSEVFDLREYNQGDKLNRIHWKLSSKKDEFIVKDYSFPVDSPAVIFLDLMFKEKSEYTLPVFDTLAEILVSLSQFMIENERIHSIVYYDALNKKFVEKSITDFESLAAAVSEMIFSLNDSLYAESPEVYFMEKSELSLSSFTYITADNNAKILTYIDENVDADLKNALLVVKDNNSSAPDSDMFNTLAVTPVVIGRITSSIKDIEI